MLDCKTIYLYDRAMKAMKKKTVCVCVSQQKNQKKYVGFFSFKIRNSLCTNKNLIQSNTNLNDSINSEVVHICM